MSLKAKLEAVIYAAEEPVTLNQLAALFAADALEWKAALEAAAAEQAAELAGVSPDAMRPLPLIELGEAPVLLVAAKDAPAVIDAPAAEPAGAMPEPDEKADSDAPRSDEVVSISEEEAYPSIVVEGDPAADAPGPVAPSAPADAETDAKRLARQKDREVKAVLKQLLDELIAGYQADGRGVEIREIAGGYRMATKPECHDAVRLFVKSLKPALKLSLPALETLAVIAYKQPVTSPEVNEIRGVESSGVLGSLLARKLIATAGRKPVIGRPILYKTTREFLLRFGLKDVSELPSMEEFEKMAATELDMDPEVVEADRQAESAEALADREAAETESLEQNPEAILESNSPGGEELAATAESLEGTAESGSPVAIVTEPSVNSATSEKPSPAEAGEPGPAASAGQEATPVDSGPEHETEATPDGDQSDQKADSGQKAGQESEKAG
jgi:segregation and condensation protein B